MAGVGGGAAGKFRALSASINGTVAVVKSLGAAVTGLQATIQAATPPMIKNLADTGTAVVQVTQLFRDAAAEWKQHQVDMLERLRQLVIPFEGTDAGSLYSYDKQIEEAIARIKAGGDATLVIQDLQRMFAATYGVLQRQFFGNQEPGMQEFLLAIERFINSGVLN